MEMKDLRYSVELEPQGQQADIPKCSFLTRKHIWGFHWDIKCAGEEGNNLWREDLEYRFVREAMGGISDVELDKLLGADPGMAMRNFKKLYNEICDHELPAMYEAHEGIWINPTWPLEKQKATWNQFEIDHPDWAARMKQIAAPATEAAPEAVEDEDGENPTQGDLTLTSTSSPKRRAG